MGFVVLESGLDKAAGCRRRIQLDVLKKLRDRAEKFEVAHSRKKLPGVFPYVARRDNT